MGQVLTLNTTDKTYTAEVKEGVVEKAIAGVTNLFADSATKAISPDVAFWGQVLTNGVNVVATSMFTRKRAERGEDAIGGIFF